MPKAQVRDPIYRQRRFSPEAIETCVRWYITYRLSYRDLVAMMTVRSNRYLNNVVEQDHRAIKGRCAPMLGLKSFHTAAVTLAGVELAHRIRKRQFLVGSRSEERGPSLKVMWDAVMALGAIDAPANVPEAPAGPHMHQNSKAVSRSMARAQACEASPLRLARKITDGRGLYLLVTPKGGKYWRYDYAFEGKHKTMAYGIYPDVPLEKARRRHQEARSLLADGIDPSKRKQELQASLRAGLPP